MSQPSHEWHPMYHTDFPEYGTPPQDCPHAIMDPDLPFQSYRCTEPAGHGIKHKNPFVVWSTGTTGDFIITPETATPEPQ